MCYFLLHEIELGVHLRSVTALSFQQVVHLISQLIVTVAHAHRRGRTSQLVVTANHANKSERALSRVQKRLVLCNPCTSKLKLQDSIPHAVCQQRQLVVALIRPPADTD